MTHPAISDNKIRGGGNRPSGDSTKSALIHLPAAGEGGLAAQEGEEGEAVINRRLGDDLPSPGERPHSAGA